MDSSIILNDVDCKVNTIDTEFGEETLINIPKQYKYLSEVFNTLPKNAFFCKSVCGVGGTFLSIESDENYVIAVGSVELIYNKTQQHKNLLGVYGNFKIKDIEFYIVMCKLFGFPIKIMTTYDSLWKVTEALKDNVSSCNLLIDEIQVLLKNSDEFKPTVVAKVFMEVNKYASVCYMTATATPRKYFPNEMKGLEYIRLNWEGSVLMNVNTAKIGSDVTSKVVAIALKHLDEGGTPLFFYNSLKGIIPCIKKLVVARKLTHKDIKIICADNEKNRQYLKEQLGEKWLPERPLYKEIDENGNEHLDPKNKPIQFITKYAFEGLDFLVEDAYTYIISDIKNKKSHHSRIDISTDIQQICGRCRNQNPLIKREAVFLWNEEFDGVDMSEDDFEKYVHNNLEIARDLDNRYSLNTLEDMKIEFESSPYFVEVDGKCIVNEWSIYGMCIAHSALKVGYYRVMSKDGDDTISNVDNNLKIFSEVSSYSIPPIPITDKKNMDLKQNFSDLAKTYYDYWLDYNNTHNENSLKEMEYIKSVDKEFCEIVNTIGIEEIKATSFHKTKSKAKYKKAVGIDKTDVKAVKACKSLRLKKDYFYSYAELKSIIKQAYDEKDINVVAKATDIKQAFNVKRTRRNGVEGFIIGDKL